jgi:hypothetical protein
VYTIVVLAARCGAAGEYMRKTLARHQAGMLLALLVQLTYAGAARAIPINAGDLAPAPAGTTGVFTYFTHTLNGGADSTDNAVDTQGAHLRSQCLLLRPYYFLDIAGTRAVITAAIPWERYYDGRLDHQDLGSARGGGSTALAMGFWLLNQPAQQRFVTLAPFLWLPTGDYDPHRALNTGENRWKGSLQTGFHQGFGALSFEFAADVTFYGDNPDYGAGHQRLSALPGYELQAWLRHDYSKEFHYEAGFSQLLGGQQSVDGTENGFRTERSRVRLEAGYLITPKIEILNEVARDVAVTGGYKADFTNTLRINVGF